jgi:hypothetical protein
MKKFFKMFFISFLFFVSLGALSICEESHAENLSIIQNLHSRTQSELSLDFGTNEKSIVSQNNTQTELYASSSKKENFGFGNLAKSIFLPQVTPLFSKLSNINSNYTQSHKISLRLEHEICTRAP